MVHTGDWAQGVLMIILDDVQRCFLIQGKSISMYECAKVDQKSEIEWLMTS